MEKYGKSDCEYQYAVMATHNAIIMDSIIIMDIHNCHEQ